MSSRKSRIATKAMVVVEYNERRTWYEPVAVFTRLASALRYVEKLEADGRSVGITSNVPLMR